MKAAAGTDAKAIFAGYKIALDDVPGEILEQVLIDFIKGQAGDHSAVFLPTPAELRQYCEKSIKFAQDQIGYAQKLLDAPEEKPTRSERVSPEKMAALARELRKAASNQAHH